VSLLRRISNGRLTVLLVLVVAAGAALGTGIAVAARSGSPPPPPASLSDAVHGALTAPTPDGVSGRLKFTNRLLGSGLLSGAVGSSPLLTGATGRFWITGDGKARLELQGSDGSADVQILVDGTSLEVYDVSSNTLYKAQLPQQSQTTPSSSGDHTAPSVAQIQNVIDKLAGVAAIAGPTPTTIAGEGAYSVRFEPKANGGLVGGAELAWDATHGVPLRAALYAKGDSTPVLELTATEISFAPVAASDVDITPAAGARVVDLGILGAGNSGSQQKPTPVTGLAAVQAQLPFTLVAPDTLAGRQRTEVRLVHPGGEAAAVVIYGTGIDGIGVLESQHHSTQQSGGMLGMLPSTDLGGGVKAQELPTALGTIVRFEHGGVTFVVAASQPTATVVDAAKTLAG
jgi:outer membrane lipoprotein-sorting protein